MEQLAVVAPLAPPDMGNIHVYEEFPNDIYIKDDNDYHVDEEEEESHNEKDETCLILA